MFGTPLNNISQILDMKRYNGRVNVAEPEDPDARFKMFSRVASKNKSADFYGLRVGNWEDNILEHTFFSKENIQILQNGIRAGVYKNSPQKVVIPPQNLDQLQIVMRSIYLQHARHRKDNISGQIEELNKLVLLYCVPFLIGETTSYLKYLQDQSTLVVPLERETRPDRVYHQLEINPWV
jgi:hypothetical protein